MNPQMHSTTIICVRKDGKVALAGDGQVTLGDTVIKHGAKKIRRLYNNKILSGFAGSSADSFALFSRFESKLEQFHGNLSRAAVELAKDWRTDRSLRHLEAVMVVADDKNSFLIAGNGDLDRTGRRTDCHRLRRPVRTRGRTCSPEVHRLSARAKSRRKRCRSPRRSAFTRTTASL